MSTSRYAKINWLNKKKNLDGEDIVALVLFSGHDKTELTHALSTSTRKRLAFRKLASPGAIAIFLMELLLASLALSLQALNDVNGSTDVNIVVILGLVVVVPSVLELSK